MKFVYAFFEFQSSREGQLQLQDGYVRPGLVSWFMAAWRCGSTEGSVKLSLTD